MNSKYPLSLHGNNINNVDGYVNRYILLFTLHLPAIAFNNETHTWHNLAIYRYPFTSIRSNNGTGSSTGRIASTFSCRNDRNFIIIRSLSYPIFHALTREHDRNGDRNSNVSLNFHSWSHSINVSYLAHYEFIRNNLLYFHLYFFRLLIRFYTPFQSYRIVNRDWRRRLAYCEERCRLNESGGAWRCARARIGKDGVFFSLSRITRAAVRPGQTGWQHVSP